MSKTSDATTSVAPAEQNVQPKFAFLRTRRFYLVLLLGQFLSLCIVATNTFTSLLANGGTSIPAFQTLFLYVLLNVVFTPYTFYKYGFRGWARMVGKSGWKYLILAFLDVEGNYFVVLAYRYTTILSAQLINFWAIVVVVIVSFFLLKVRYHWTQIAGIMICIGGVGILIGSDHIQGTNGGTGPNNLKGDLFMLLGATFYGLCNVAQEFLVSQAPIYEVIGQLGLYAMTIMGVQAAIFDRNTIKSVVWGGDMGGYLTGYTLALFLFYCGAPILFRSSSAAFFNISLLTANFWGVIIGTRVFGYSVHFLYPIAFVLIICGQVFYYLLNGTFGEALKPWLGQNQERGVNGIGTAKRTIAKRAANDTSVV